MIGLESADNFFLILIYIYIYQSIVSILGWKLKEKREKLLNWNILIGLFPLMLILEILFSYYNGEYLLWHKLDWIFTFSCICSVLNICFWIVSRVFRLSIIKLRWYFFVYINVIGGWMFSIMI